MKIILCVCIAFGLCASERGQFLIDHVKASIANAEAHRSQLDSSVLRIDGMSSHKVRHFLNNLCSMNETNYLEIGCWKGSTWISSLYRNDSSIQSASVIDDWNHHRDVKDDFLGNCKAHLPNENYTVFDGDCFQFELSLIPLPVNIYFYDAGHTQRDQEQAFTYFNDVFDDVFIAIVDDWNWQEVKDGTRLAFEKLQYEILFEIELPARHNGDTGNWWNGLFVAVIQKPS